MTTCDRTAWSFFSGGNRLIASSARSACDLEPTARDATKRTGVWERV